jgi:uncharacterized membrane protein YjjP (DUF1212 family)
MSEAPPPSSTSMSDATVVFVYAAVLLFGVLALSLKSGKRAIFQGHAAIIGGILCFVAGFAACNAADRRLSGIAVPLLAGAICSLPGLGVGFLLGKKERT